jgi:CheY-like chemotaxis protein
MLRADRPISFQRCVRPDSRQLGCWRSARDKLISRHSAPQTEPADRIARQHPMRILIVDDDAGTRGIIRRVLTHDLKCEVREASDGRQALAAVEEFDFDAAIFDLQMPQMDGLEALAHLRKSPRHTSLPVIVLTASADEAAVRQAAVLGITAYLTKPINAAKLSPRLKKLLDRIAGIESPDDARSEHSLDPDRPVLVADADVTFRALMAGVVTRRAPVIEVESGFRVLQAFMVKGDAPVPQMVVLSPNTGLLGGPTLVDRIRKLQLIQRPRVVGVYPPELVEETRRNGVFDAVMVRLDDADQMRAQFDRLCGEVPRE